MSEVENPNEIVKCKSCDLGVLKKDGICGWCKIRIKHQIQKSKDWKTFVNILKLDFRLAESEYHLTEDDILLAVRSITKMNKLWYAVLKKPINQMESKSV